MNLRLSEATCNRSLSPWSRELGRHVAHFRLSHQYAGPMSNDRPKLGACCKELAEVLRLPNSLFRIEPNGVLYLSVAFAETSQGTGWYDQAPLFCPFCGAQIQNRVTIKNAGTS